jgi:hypothetical protein
MNTELSLILEPHLPWAVLAAGRLPGARRDRLGRVPPRARRLVAGAVPGPAPGGAGEPDLRREERQALDDIVLVVKDASPSGRLAGRPEQLAAAEEEIRRRLGATPGVELREVELEGRGARAARCSRAWPTRWPRPTARGSAPSSR